MKMESITVPLIPHHRKAPPTPFFARLFVKLQLDKIPLAPPQSRLPPLVVAILPVKVQLDKIPLPPFHCKAPP